ncbi:MAG TPA: alpha-1,4-glucan--maltose-1-phosphate maltosyltransferase [Methyloceanibacter sp.]|nr:alpha-1,4-glucan--maltose-1-phosphate maltosyltransferase [Methyloceanibacter sp.]
MTSTPTPDLEALRKAASDRIAIEAVSPEIDGGRFPARRAVDDVMVVEADVFCDGHDKIDAALRYRCENEEGWHDVPMQFLGNDRWRAEFPLTNNARYLYTIVAWRDLYATWCDEIAKKHGAGQTISLELIEARHLIEETIAAAGGSEADRRGFQSLLKTLDLAKGDVSRLECLTSEETQKLFARAGLRTNVTGYSKVLSVWVDRRRAVFSAWYEMFPRSQSGDANRHGTFDDVIARLPYVRDLGFDVLYFPPIHPIGKTNRKGRNNSLKPTESDPGSPYAIGSDEGGHDAIHAELGTFADFARLITAAKAHGLEIALDFAIQCSPDHPWIKEHPEWFDWRPDGTIKFAENPPKKYEDIVNVHFYGDAFPSIWLALRDIVLFWAEKGVRIFRVDNPHTKPFPFWEWMIREVQDRYADVIFLAEAFTRPAPMKRLAKLGFTQSYTYFTWRNTKQELTEYATELTQSDMSEYFRPNFFVNTPDINPPYLQDSGRAGFQSRLVLAATLAGNYGIYNGVEICEARAIPGKEEYLDSEKYEIVAWDWDRKDNIRADITLINRLRNEHPALQQLTGLSFYNFWNDEVLYYGKWTEDLSDFLLFAVNLDPHNAQGGHFEVPLWEFGLPDSADIGVEDLVTGKRFTWSGKVQHMLLDPNDRPYAIWRLLPKETAAG